MNETQLPLDGGQSSGSEDRQPSDALPADEAAGWSAQFVVPFQQSGPMPAVNPQLARASTNRMGSPAQGRTTPRRFPILKVVLISALIVLAVGFLALSVFAQPATHQTTAAKNPTQGPLMIHASPTVRPTRTVQKTPM